MHRSSASPSLHTQFFTSLKQVEKRLKLENHSQQSSTHSPSQPPRSPPPPVLPGDCHENTKDTLQTDSLGTPIYLNFKHHSTTIIHTNASTLQESEVPREFLTNSSDFPATDDGPLPENHSRIEETVEQDERRYLDDDVELLMQFLRLSDSVESKKRMDLFNVGCDDGFYRKIARMKGPKSSKELERLEGWIKHFLNCEKKEPFILAHLLLGKAACLHSADNSDGFEGFEFPSTIDEFFEKEPPSD